MDILFHATPRGIQIPVASLKERCPDPLDDRGRQELYYESDQKVVNSMTKIPFSYWFPYWFSRNFPIYEERPFEKQRYKLSPSFNLIFTPDLEK
jgi:hypothetical protein